MNQCLKCNSQRLVSGKIISSRGFAIFAPDGRRWLSLSLFGGVQFTDPAAVACLDCGFVGAFVSKVDLQDFVQKHCRPDSNEPTS